MTKYGLLRTVSLPTRLLGDDKGRRILFRVDKDPTGSFAIFQDLVSSKFLGWDADEQKLILVDEAVTTRNLLQVKGPLSSFSILGSAEQGGTINENWSLKPIRYRPF